MIASDPVYSAVPVKPGPAAHRSGRSANALMQPQMVTLLPEFTRCEESSRRRSGRTKNYLLTELCQLFHFTNVCVHVCVRAQRAAPMRRASAMRAASAGVTQPSTDKLKV